jgi:CBS domain-containing protein
MGIAGPLVSVALGLICLGIARSMGWAPMADPATPAMAVLVWLGYINLVLAVFNMIPGYPLDGGRVLRAIVWWYTGSMERATRVAAGVGQLFAYGFILLGLWRFFSGQGFGGLWLAFIGWFLLDAARSSYAQVEAMALLRGVRVRDVMTPDFAMIDTDMDLQSLVEERLLRTGTRCFLVGKDGYLVGLITPHDIGKIERERWPETTVAQAMRPLRELRTVSPQTPVTDALDLMSRQNVNQLPVVTDGRLEGLLSRGHVLQLLQTRAELHM